MIERFSDRICGCCGRAATGFAYAPRADRDALYVCDDPECLTVAKNSYTLPQDVFTRIEGLAAEKGGEAAGAFLEQIGKTDLVGLTGDEWSAFCRRLVAGYRKALIEDLKEEAPF